MLNRLVAARKGEQADEHPDQWVVNRHLQLAADGPPRYQLLPPPKICKFCNNLEKKNEDDPRLALELTVEQVLGLEKSKSCEICFLIVEGIRKYEDPTWSLGRDVSRVYVYALSSRGDSLTVEVFFRTERPKLILEFYHTDEWKSPWEAIRRRSPVTGYPVMTKGVEWVKSTLEQCLHEHASCAITEEPLLPKRTLYVEKLSSGEVSVKLIEHKDQRGRYIALSHCWGSQRACITTSENLQAYQKSVPWQALPITFQDAINLTLALGVHHIWVDSLCIIQNNATDWEVESSRMGDIYQNSYLTLAATAASDGSKGCFSVQRKQVREFRLLLRSTTGSMMVREKIHHWQAQSTQASAKAFPLLTRGWVLQERHLSPRTLHFCSQELVWECLEDLTCECKGILADCEPLGRLQLVDNTIQLFESITDTDEPSEFTSDFVRVIPESPSASESDEPPPRKTIAEVITKRRHIRSRSWTRAKEKLSTSMQRMRRRSTGSRTSSYETEKLDDPSITAVPSEGQNTNLLSPDAAHGEEAHGEEARGEESILLPSYQTSQTIKHLEHISDQWHSIVEQYTALDLTKESDRLPALSGLAVLASSMLGTYYCGLWLDTIANDLLWRVPLLKHEYGRPKEYTGPSWSWASVNGPIAYWTDLDDQDNSADDEIERLRYEMNTLETWYDRKEAKLALQRRLLQRAALRQKPLELKAKCEVTLRGENPFGEVCSGRLTVTGRIREARLLYVSYVEDNYREVHDPLRYQLAVQTSAHKHASYDIELPFFADYILSGSDGIPNGTPLTLFQLRQNVCLVLTRGPTYKRIGIVRQSSGYRLLYGLDWMSGASIETIAIL